MVISRQTRRLGSSVSIKAMVWWIAVLAIAAFAAAFSATQIWREKAPALALTIDGSEPKALIKAASLQLGDIPAPRKAKALTDQALIALRREPLMPDGLRVLAMATLDPARQAWRSRVIRQSYQMSRRDVGAQLLMVKECEKAQDLPCLLKHYDQAMIVSPNTREAMLPGMISVIPAPEFQQAMAPYVKRDRPWLASFYSEAMSAGTALPALARMTLSAGGLPQDEKYRSIERDLVTAMIDKGHWAAAQRYFLSLRGADRSLLTSPAFTAASLDPEGTRLAWSFPEPSGAGAETPALKDADDGILVYADAGKRDVVGRKFLFLPAGGHRLTARFGAVEMGEGDGLSVGVYCRGDAEGLTLVSSTPFQPRQGSAMSWSFNTRATCPVQLVEITASASDRGNGMEAAIAAISVSSGNP